KLVKEGADILDIGAESTRPGSPVVPLEEELKRLRPVLDEVLKLGVPVSVDTYKPQTMQAVLDFGVDIINDVWGARMVGSVDVLASHRNCGVCLMHMHGEPETMHLSPMSGEALPEVKRFLKQQAEMLKAIGIAHERIVVDYGIGFGKTLEQNFELLARQDALLELGYPLLSAWSRKRSLGAVTGREVDERLAASLAIAVLALERGASIVRVHDVKETVDALKVQQAVKCSYRGL
ncbi:MAG: dihydropteroate synthase, partial [Saezia sp.]